MAKGTGIYVKKKVVRKDGVLTTVRVRVDKDKKLQRKKKLRTLISKYNTINKKLNADIDKKDGEKSLSALAIKLMIMTGIRVGNEESAAGIKSKITKQIERTYGVTTLDKSHVTIKGMSIELNFVGKKRVPHSIEITNKKMVEQLLWAYNEHHDRLLNVHYNDIKRYTYNNIGKEYTPHDFRGLRANLEALKKINQINKRPKPKTKTEVNGEIKEIAEHVAKILGNTMGVSKRSYIDDDIILEHLHRRFNPKKKKK